MSTETPPTDAAAFYLFWDHNSAHWRVLDQGAYVQGKVVPEAVARSLERRNSELTARVAELESQLKIKRATLADVAKSLVERDAALAESRKDSARIDAIIANKWTITWNYLRDSFIVQSKDQVCGNIGHSKPLRELLDAATPLPEMKEGQL